jgi:hypothetical protein
MTINLAAEAESLYQTAIRLQRVGLVVDHRALSPAQRRAAFFLQCRAVQHADRHPTRPPIGFAYPTAGTPARSSQTDPSQGPAQSTPELV